MGSAHHQPKLAVEANATSVIAASAAAARVRIASPRSARLGRAAATRSFMRPSQGRTSSEDCECNTKRRFVDVRAVHERPDRLEPDVGGDDHHRDRDQPQRPPFQPLCTLGIAPLAPTPHQDR